MDGKKKQTKKKAEQIVASGRTADLQSEEQVSLRLKNVAEFARFSFELEEKREQSVVHQTGQMLTAFSVTSAVVLMLVPLLLEHTCLPNRLILFSAGVALALILAGMAFAVCSQWRFKYETMLDGKKLLQKIEEAKEKHMRQFQYDYQWIDQLEKIQVSKMENDDKRCSLIRKAMLIFGISIAVMFLLVCLLVISCLL